MTTWGLLTYSRSDKQQQQRCVIFDMTRRVAGGGLLIDTRPSVDGALRVNIGVTR